MDGEDGDALLAALSHAPLRIDQSWHHRGRDRFLTKWATHRVIFQNSGQIDKTYEVEFVAGKGEEGEDDNVEDRLAHHGPLVAVGAGIVDIISAYNFKFVYIFKSGRLGPQKFELHILTSPDMVKHVV